MFHELWWKDLFHLCVILKPVVGFQQMAESEQELKILLMKVKVESEKVGLKLNIQKMKIMTSGPITSWEIDGETVETVSDFIFLGSKITADICVSILYWCFSFWLTSLCIIGSSFIHLIRTDSNEFTFSNSSSKSYLFHFACKLDLFPSKNGACSLKSDQLIRPSGEYLKPSPWL